jgi:putative hemolysin
MLIVEIIAVLVLFALNGFFAMAELAIISSRRAHLERLAKEGRPGARIALDLSDDPARMLAAVQIGVTTTATLAGIFSGATLPKDSAKRWRSFRSWSPMGSLFLSLS